MQSPSMLLKELDKMSSEQKLLGWVYIPLWIQFSLQTILSADYWLLLRAKLCSSAYAVLNLACCKTLPPEYFAQNLSVNGAKCFFKVNECSEQGYVELCVSPGSDKSKYLICGGTGRSKASLWLRTDFLHSSFRLAKNHSAEYLLLPSVRSSFLTSDTVIEHCQSSWTSAFIRMRLNGLQRSL